MRYAVIKHNKNLGKEEEFKKYKPRTHRDFLHLQV